VNVARHSVREGERFERETEHYTTLAQMASAAIKIISDTVAGRRERGRQRHEF
jgi:hypothetical protein